MGRNNLEIPTTHPVHDIWVELSDEEKIIYKRLEQRFVENINSEQTSTDAKSKTLRSYFSFLTRLRQGVDHPFLLEAVMDANFTLEDLHHIKMKLRETGGVKAVHKQLRDCNIPEKEPIVMDYDEREKTGAEEFFDDGEAPDAFGKGSFGGVFDMDAQLASLMEQKSPEGLKCRCCKRMPQNAHMTTVCLSSSSCC